MSATGVVHAQMDCVHATPVWILPRGAQCAPLIAAGTGKNVYPPTSPVKMEVNGKMGNVHVHPALQEMTVGAPGHLLDPMDTST